MIEFLATGLSLICILFRNSSNLSTTGSNRVFRASRRLLLHDTQYTSRPSGMLLFTAKLRRLSCALHERPGHTFVLGACPALCRAHGAARNAIVSDCVLDVSLPLQFIH
jgi:hypothetical protein